MKKLLTSAAAVLIAAVVAVPVFAARGSADFTRFVALGDSYSSGVGTNSYTLARGCKRSVYAYPYLYTQQHPGTSLSFGAKAGPRVRGL